MLPLLLHLGHTEERPVAAENAEAPGLIKVVINITYNPFIFKGSPPISQLFLLSPSRVRHRFFFFLSSRFADGGDVKEGPFARKSGLGSNRRFLAPSI